MKNRIEIEETLHDVYTKTDLLKFEAKLAAEKQLTRLEHFDVVTDDELVSYGLSIPAVRRLRAALDKEKKKAKKSKNKIFTLGKKTGNQSKLIIAQYEPEEVRQNGAESPAPSSMPCLIGREEIKLMETLGEGTFAIVKRAIWNKPNGQKLDVAVKILREISEEVKADLHAEIMNMQKLRHTNLIQLHGIVYGEPTLMVIEFCEGGALLDRLRDQDKSVLLVTKLLNYAQQIASGMAYLESRRCVHRDLAARNVLLADNENIVKICDFGMTRHLNENERLYVMSGMKKVPFSWCPPESLSRRQFSHQSDVWAFGVLLWELYTYGEEPWAGYRAADVLRMTEGGERLRAPEKASKELYDLMMMCWQLQPENRPKFSLLRQLLKEIRFTLAECRSEHPAETPSELNLVSGNKVIIINERNWYGQSTNSGKFGVFSRSIVAIKTSRQPTANPSHLSPTKDGSYISRPVPGSLIHTGHGDIDDKNCWGYVEKIDPIYLQNPILRSSSSNTSPRINFIPSVAALDGTPRILPLSETSKSSPPRPPKQEDKPKFNATTNNLAHKFEDDFKPRSYSHEATPARPSSAVPFQSSSPVHPTPALPPPVNKQRISPPPKPTKRPVSITPEVQAKVLAKPIDPTPVMKPLEPTPMPALVKSSNSASSSFNNVNFRATAFAQAPPPQENRRQTTVPMLPTREDDQKRNTVVGGVKPSLEHLQKQKEAFSWINLDTIQSARDKIMQPKVDPPINTLPKVSSTSVLTPTPVNIVPKKQTTPPPVLAANFITSSSTSSLSSNSVPSMGIDLVNSLHSSTSSMSAQTKVPGPDSAIPRPTASTSTNSAPSSIRVSTAAPIHPTTNSAPSTVRVSAANDRILSPEKARPQVANIFPPPSNKAITKPIANIQPMQSVQAPPSGPDPFMISDDVKTLAAKARYSQVHTKLATPMEILTVGGSFTTNGFSSGSNGFAPSSYAPSYNSMSYPPSKPTTGLYPGLSPSSLSSSSTTPSNIPPSSDDLINSILRPSTGLYPGTNAARPTNGISAASSPSMSIPPSSDELFPEFNTRPGTLATATSSVLTPTVVPAKTPTLTQVSSAPTMANSPTVQRPTNTTAPTMVRPPPVTNVASVLPPPSSLLLSGTSTSRTPSLLHPTPSSSSLPSSSNTANPTYPNSFSATVNRPPQQTLPPQTAPLYAVGNSSNVGWNHSLYNPSSQFSSWSMNQPSPTMYMPNVVGNGTLLLQPQVLQPTRAMPLPTASTNTPISLDFLDLTSLNSPLNQQRHDTDENVAKVRSLYDGASVDKCRQFLKKFNGDVNRTVRELKIAQLLEIGIAGDRELAISALDSCRWDVNAAAERLLTS